MTKIMTCLLELEGVGKVKETVIKDKIDQK